MRFSIDDEFRRLIYPLTRQEYADLENEILSSKKAEPVLIWNGSVIEGYERMEICRKYDIKVKYEYTEFESKEAVIVWLCEEQLKRKGINEDFRKYLFGKLYHAEKIVNRIKSSRGEREQLSSDDKTGRLLTAKGIGSRHGFCPSSAQKYGVYSNAVDKIWKKHPELAEKILSGRYNFSHNTILKLESLDAEQMKAVCNQLSGSRRVVRPVEVFQGGIKSMPVFDPDAGLTELILTMPSWKSSIIRVQGQTDLSIASPEAKKKMKLALAELGMCVMNFLDTLKEEK